MTGGGEQATGPGSLGSGREAAGGVVVGILGRERFAVEGRRLVGRAADP